MELKLRVQPGAHQFKAASFLIPKEYGILNYATGSGKSIIQILICFYLLVNKISTKTIIVCPKSGMISVCEDFNENTLYSPVVVNKKEEFIDFLNSDINIAVVNYNLAKDCLEYLTTKDGKIKVSIDKELEDSLKKHKLTIFFDEFHTLKSKNSQVTKSWSVLKTYANKVYGVTASTYFKDLHDLYFLVAFLDKKIFKSMTNFRDSFMEWEMKRLWKSKKMIPTFNGYKNLPTLKMILDGLMCTYNPELDVEYVNHYFKIVDKEAYIEAAKGLFQLAETESISPKVWSARLPDLQRVVDSDYAKLATLKELAIKLKSEGFIVYSGMIESIEKIKLVLDSLEIEYKEITGASDIKDRKIIKDWFNKSPKYKCLIISDAGGQSLNLQSVNNLICYNLPFGIGKFIQIRGRIVRQYSKHDKFYIHILIGTATVDEYKYVKITQHQQVYDMFFGVSITNESATMTEVNGFLTDYFKKSYLWKR